jgi:hypothetical protein
MYFVSNVLLRDHLGTDFPLEHFELRIMFVFIEPVLES